MEITKVDDPIVQELKRIVENELPVPCLFVYANLAEANFGMDHLDQSETRPVFIFLATDRNKNKVNEAGMIIRTVPVVGMMLQMVDDNTTAEYSSEAAAPYVYAMQQLTDNLIYRINKSPLTHKVELVEEYEFNKLYAKFDKNLFGGGVTFNWAFLTNTRGC